MKCVHTLTVDFAWLGCRTLSIAKDERFHLICIGIFACIPFDAYHRSLSPRTFTFSSWAISTFGVLLKAEATDCSESSATHSVGPLLLLESHTTRTSMATRNAPNSVLFVNQFGNILTYFHVNKLLVYNRFSSGQRPATTFMAATSQ